MKNPIITLFGIQTALMAILVAVNIYTANKIYKLEREYQPQDDTTLSSMDEKLRCMAITLQWIERNTSDAEQSLSKIANPSLPASLYQTRSTPPSPC